MKQGHSMGQIEDLRLFVRTVDSGGIARAAAEMGIAINELKVEPVLRFLPHSKWVAQVTNCSPEEE